jgi:uncharacterized membrane protein
VADSVSDSIVIAADVDTVLEVVADFEAYPSWQRDIKAAEVLATDDDGWGTRARFVVDARILTAELVLDYTYTDTSMSWVLSSSDQLTKNDGSYELTDRGDGTTEVTYTLEVETKVAVPSVIRRRAARHIVDSGLAGLKARVEQHT